MINLWEIIKKQKIYIFFDESGKPEIYSAKGVNLVETGVATKYLVLASVRVGDQLFLQQSVTDFKLQLLKDESLVKIFSSAYALDSFHAQSDYRQVREKFTPLSIICRMSKLMFWWRKNSNVFQI